VADLRSVPASALLGELGQDPLGATVDPAPSVELALRCARHHPAVASWAADGTRWDAAGVDAAAQVGIVVGNATAALRLLVDAGLSLQAAAGQIVLHLAVGPDQFLGMAQVRALRRCWARVLDACGQPDAAGAGRVHATVSAAALTRRDPWVNLLRATSAAFAAAAGGADGITVLPFDSAVGAPADQGRRLARNTQLILQEESGLHRVIDPAGGSWYVEALTDSLAHAAWARFQELEAAGGFAAAIRGGVVSTWADREWLRTVDEVARRRRAITGVSEFPIVDEAALVRPPSGETVPVRRPAELFERLRDAADAMPARPVVHRAPLGTQAEYSARTAFATNLFAAGGLAVAIGDSVPAGGLACLCSSDEHYGDEGAEAVARLRAAGAAEVWLAGQVDVPGVDRQIHMGCDAVAALQRAHALLGVPT
jgi:methylmalonyl-CoA mutase